tara:strand:- start:554 stop:775 length:222 start_codon:yes stop_codon:yes gene_type:complete
MPKKNKDRKELKTWECEFEGPIRHPAWRTIKVLQKGFNLNHAINKAKKKAKRQIVNPRLINAKQLLTELNEQS